MTEEDDLYCSLLYLVCTHWGQMVKAEPISMAKKHADAICERIKVTAIQSPMLHF